MRDELARRGGAVRQKRGERYNRHIIFNGRVIRLSNANMKFLDVLYKSISAFFFLKLYLQSHI